MKACADIFPIGQLPDTVTNTPRLSQITDFFNQSCPSLMNISAIKHIKEYPHLYISAIIYSCTFGEKQHSKPFTVTSIIPGMQGA